MTKEVWNPANPYAEWQAEPFFDGWTDEGFLSDVQVTEENAKSIVSENKSPDVPFTYSVNPYRGCRHGCIYCYARPTHQYLELGAGSDFERRLIVKTNAVRLLRDFLRRKGPVDMLAFSGITDAYQPLEKRYSLTRSLLELCFDFGQPVGIITKSSLVTRDAEILAGFGEAARVYISLPTLNPKVSSGLEPGAPTPAVRLRAMQYLSGRGIPVGVAVAPIIPGLTDHEVPAILAAAAKHGASWAFNISLRLPAEVKDVFLKKTAELFPGRARKVENKIKAMRGGRHYENGFHQRMSGRGPGWKITQDLFAAHVRKNGLNLREAGNSGAGKAGAISEASAGLPLGMPARRGPGFGQRLRAGITDDGNGQMSLWT